MSVSMRLIIFGRRYWMAFAIFSAVILGIVFGCSVPPGGEWRP